MTKINVPVTVEKVLCVPHITINTTSKKVCVLDHTTAAPSCNNTDCTDCIYYGDNHAEIMRFLSKEYIHDYPRRL